MAFTWLNKQGVRSDQGFEVQIIERFVFVYKEGSRQISVEFEDGYSAGKPWLIIKESEFEKWDNGQTISKQKQAGIIKNITDAMDFQGVGVEII